MARQFVMLLGSILVLACPATAQSSHNQQWQYLATNGSGQIIPISIFLPPDYRQVPFVGNCYVATATLKLHYPACWPHTTSFNSIDLGARFAATLPHALSRRALSSAEPPLESSLPNSPSQPDESWPFVGSPAEVLTSMGNAAEKVDCGRSRILARIEWIQHSNGRREEVRVSTFLPPYGGESAHACLPLEAAYRTWFDAQPDTAFLPVTTTVMRRFDLMRAPADLPPPFD